MSNLPVNLFKEIVSGIGGSLPFSIESNNLLAFSKILRKSSLKENPFPYKYRLI